MWQQSQVAVLRQTDTGAGYKLQSSYSTPGRVISFTFVCIVTVITLVFTVILPRYARSRRPALSQETLKSTDQLTDVCSRNGNPSFWAQFKALLLPLRWHEYRPTTINNLRVVEVIGLGLLTGFLFQDVGKNSTATGLGEKTSLLFFSTTLWCQTRICILLLVEKNQSDLLPVFLSRMVVVSACEAWWPFLFVFCAYPLASMFGSFSKVFTIGVFLVLNNSCYIAIGALLGTVMPTVNLGMIGATLFGQMPFHPRIVRHRYVHLSPNQ